MTARRLKSFRALTAFVRGYLHQDYAHVSGSPAAALEAFWRDASDRERQQLARDLEALSRQLAGADPAKVIDVLTGRFGSGWLPAGREDIDQLVETASRLRAADASRLS